MVIIYLAIVQKQQRSQLSIDSFQPDSSDFLATSDALPGQGVATAASFIFGPLGDNGGPTQTHPLVIDSPALDVILVNALTTCPESDQRGQSRRINRCDIGAFEAQAGEVLPPPSTNQQESCYVIPLANGKVVHFCL